MLVPNLPPKILGAGCTDDAINKRSRKKVAILGSTGSIGVSTLNLIAQRDDFEVVALTCNQNITVLKHQIDQFKPKFVSVGNGCSANEVKLACKVIDGPDSLVKIAQLEEVDIVVAAVVGFAALEPVLAALRAGKLVALANKECLVAGGALVADAIKLGKGILVPVDSEHSAVFQCLSGNRRADLSRVILTASGGPFLNLDRTELTGVRPEDAVKHPRWSMGKKISIDSATMMNKALELIEAYWLFGAEEPQIEVIIHPESIVHSLVEFVDGSLIAQLSNPDMSGPISYAINFGAGRVPGAVPRLNLKELRALNFFPLNDARFPAISLARSALKLGGGAGAVLNAANEVAVEKFLAGKVRFDQIDLLVADVLEQIGGPKYSSLEDLKEIDTNARNVTSALVKT